MSFETGEENCNAFGDLKDDNQPNIDEPDFDDDDPEPNWDMDPDIQTPSYKVYL
jgi:hypothetical protein